MWHAACLKVSMRETRNGWCRDPSTVFRIRWRSADLKWESVLLAYSCNGARCSVSRESLIPPVAKIVGLIRFVVDFVVCIFVFSV